MPTAADIQKWFDEHVDESWGADSVSITTDADEILAVIKLSTKEGEIPEDEEDREVAVKRIARHFRKSSRQSRMAVADSAQELFERKVSWGVRAGEDAYLFTHVTAPAMTRLRLSERKVLDTLVDSGVAGSRSEALAWCVRYVRDNQSDWLENLRDAFKAVEKIRDEGPAA